MFWERHVQQWTKIDHADDCIGTHVSCAFQVLAVRCVQGPYPSRLLDLWELFDECKGSENDNPAALPSDQQYIVLELANAGQDLESYQFTGAQQAHALFQQVTYMPTTQKISKRSHFFKKLFMNLTLRQYAG